MVHAHGARAAELAARAGAGSIEHGTYLDEAAVQAMAESGTWYVPTLSVTQSDLENAPDGAAEAHRESMRLAIEAGVRATDASYEVRCPWRWTNRLFYACAVLLALIAVITIWTGNWVCTLPYGLLAVESAVWPWLQNATYRFGYRHGWDRVAGWWPERKAAGDG